MTGNLIVPPDLVRRLAGRPADTGSDGDTWLRELPGLAERRLRAWDLQVAGTPMNGHNALVLPVLRDGERLVLKISWPHREAAFEHVGLRHWDGAGAVRLVAASPADHTLLLEAIGPDDLQGLDVLDACEVIGGLLARLHVAPPPSVPAFEKVVTDWIAPLRELPASLPRRWVERAIEIFDHHPFDPVLLHLDLHYSNVLASAREPWLAIDPKPVAGPRGFDVYPALANRAEEYDGGPPLERQVRERLEALCDSAGMDVDEARAWSLAHAVLNAYELGEDGWPTLVSLNLAIAKVVAEP